MFGEKYFIIGEYILLPCSHRSLIWGGYRAPGVIVPSIKKRVKCREQGFEPRFTGRIMIDVQ
jgi:hypothetical protein